MNIIHIVVIKSKNKFILKIKHPYLSLRINSVLLNFKSYFLLLLKNFLKLILFQLMKIMSLTIIMKNYKYHIIIHIM